MLDLSKVKKCGIIDTLFKPVLANKMTYANSNLTPKQNISDFNAFEATHQVSFRLWWVFCLAVLLVGGLISFPHKASAVTCTAGVPCTISITVSAQDPEADPVYGKFFASPSSYTILNCSPDIGGSGSQCTTGLLSSGSGDLISNYRFSDATTYSADYEICDNASHCKTGSVSVTVIPPSGTVTLTSYPVNPANSTSANFVWQAATNATSYGTFLDSGSYQTLATTTRSFSGLTAGSHTFTVCGLNLGISGPCTNYSWLIDFSPPTCTASLGGANGSTASAVCSDTGGSGCTGNPANQTVTGPGTYIFNVADNAGNAGSCSVTAYVHYTYNAWGVCGSWGAWNTATYTRTGTQTRTLASTYYNTTAPSDSLTTSQTCSETDDANPTINSFDVQPRTTSGSVIVTFTGADTGGTVNSGVNRYEIWRAPDANGVPGSWSAIVSPASSSYTDSPAQGVYWYGVHIVDNAGRFGTESTPLKVIIDKTAPTPNPATGWASAIMQTSITWNITVPTDSGVGLSSTPYSFDNGATWQASSSLTVGSLICGTGYSKSIMTRDALDNRTSAGTLSATTAVCLPGTVTLTGTPANPTTSTAAAFVWQAAANATSYDTYVDSGSYQNVAATNRSVTVGAGSHIFTVCGVNASGVGPCTNYSWLVDTTPPSQVTLTLSPNTTSSSFNLSWTAAVDNESGLARYELWRAPDSGGAPGSWNKVKDVAGLSTTDNPAAGVYWYGIHAVNNAGGYSTEVAAQKGTKDTTPPTPNPATGSASNVKRNAITWNITVSTDGGVGLHSLPYSFDNGATWQASNLLTDNGLNCGTQYIKTIVTRDALDNRTTAGSISQYTLDCGISGTVSFTQTPPAFTYQTGATFAWNAVSGATSYLVQLDGGTVEVIVQTTKSYSGLIQGSHTFIITPQNNGGQGTATTYSWTIDLLAPQVNSLSAVVAITNSPPIITWSAVDTGGSAIQKYELWRAPDASGTPGAWSKIIDSATAPQTDATVGANVKYWYGLHVLDNAGNCITEGGSHCGGVASDSLDPRVGSSPSGVTYDTQTPSLSGLAPLNTISSLRPALTTTVTDNLSGVNNSTVTISRAGSQVLQKTFGTVNSLNISGSDWSGPLSNATYTVRVLANDKAGNQLDQNWTFTVNNLAPNKPNLR